MSSSFDHPSGTVAGAFRRRTEAEYALRELREHGFRPDQIGVAMRDAREARELADTVAATQVEEGAAIGAVTGGALAGAAGWLTGIGALLIPGIGPIVAAGPLAVALGAAVAGAAAGGFVGALIGEGIPEDQARWYDEEVRDGAVLVTVRAGERAFEARELLREWGGMDNRSGEPAGSDSASDLDMAREDEARKGDLVGPIGSPRYASSELTPEEAAVVPAAAAGSTTPGPIGAEPGSAIGPFVGPMPTAGVQSTVESEEIQIGWRVFSSDGRLVGTVLGVEPARLRVALARQPGTLYIPLGSVGRTTHDEVYLSVPANSIDRQGWEHTTIPAEHTDPAEHTEEHTQEANSMSQFRSTASEMANQASDMARNMTSGQTDDTMSGMFSFMENIPTPAYYFAMIGSIAASLYLFLSGKRWESLFVGLWAPTIITSSMFYKLLRPSREIH